MSNFVASVGVPADEMHERRLRSLAGALGRLAALTPSSSAAARSHLVVIQELAAAGRVVIEGGGPWTVSYVPSTESLAALADGGAPSWGAKVDAKQIKALRRVRGVTFRLPFVGCDGVVEVFTTDWSPFTAACALTVHPDHPVLRGVPRGVKARELPYFTGLFVRHPLHGDLLPVWVADWVKPEFGTGAVVVNPAHSQQDLDFAREIGLPIRFGLGAAEPSADPVTWLEPPVIKSGHAIRAGRHDRLHYTEAATAYLAELGAAGHAREHELVSLGKAPLAVLALADNGELAWVRGLRAEGLTAVSLAADGLAKDGGVRVSLEPCPLLTAAQHDSGIIVATADAVTEEMLWLRLLRADLGISDQPAIVMPVARIGAIRAADPEWLDQTLTVAGKPEEVVSVRDQLTGQVARIGEAHAAAVSGAAGEDTAPVKQVSAAYEALLGGDFTAAFAGISATAKTLRKGGSVSVTERDIFLLVVNVLFGLELPAGFNIERLRAAMAR